MEAVQKFLLDNGVPFHVNKLNEKNIDCAINSSVIIPGGVVLFRTKKCANDYEKLDKLEQQMNNIFLYAPEGSMIYIYVYNTTSDSELDEVKSKFIDNINTEGEFDIVNNPNNIGIAEYSYQTAITRAIWKMCVDNVNNILDNHKVYVKEDIWRWALTGMTDEEKEVIEKYVIIGEPGTMYNCTITNSKKDNNNITGDDLFTDFLIFYQTDFSGDIKKLPVRIVNGLTDHCKICNSIVYVPYIKENGCVSCLSKDKYH
jgi:hypothetical protein